MELYDTDSNYSLDLRHRSNRRVTSFAPASIFSFCAGHGNKMNLFKSEVNAESSTITLDNRKQISPSVLNIKASADVYARWAP